MLQSVANEDNLDADDMEKLEVLLSKLIKDKKVDKIQLLKKL